MRTQSPFPGMDPWLERSWGGVHLQLIANLREQLVSQLPGDLFAEVEETVYVFNQEEEEHPPRQSYRPDVAVFVEPGREPW